MKPIQLGTDELKNDSASTTHLTKDRRIADYLNVHDAFIDEQLTKNAALLYGKFDPHNADELGDELLSYINDDEQFKSVMIQKYHMAIRKQNKPDKLIRALTKWKTSFGEKYSVYRIFFYLINMRLSELGIAPRWRGMNSPQAYPKGAVWSEEDALYARDLQVFDMEWRHRHYPLQRVSKSYGGMYTKLMEGDDFNYAHSHIVAAANFEAGDKAKSLMLTHDMQGEMMVLKSKKISKQRRKLDDAIDEVETDLELAASRNRSRGNKLRAVIPMWLQVWASAAMIPNVSLPTMLDNYERMTGLRLNRTTFAGKLKNINTTLAEVGSDHVLEL